MGLLEVLAIVFVILKLVGVISWSWLLVLSPLWIAVLLYIAFYLFVGLFIGSTHKKVRKGFGKW